MLCDQVAPPSVERRMPGEVVPERVAGRVPVIAGTGSNSTIEAVSLTRYAREAGADAALLITPYYNKPTAAGQIAHFKTVAESAGIPVMGHLGLTPQSIHKFGTYVVRATSEENLSFNLRLSTSTPANGSGLGSFSNVEPLPCISESIFSVFGKWEVSPFSPGT